MRINKYFRKLIVIPVVTSVLLTGLQFSEARENPYSHVETVTISDEAKGDYIDQKIKNFFATLDGSKDNYVVPEGWTQENLSFDGALVEKYTSSNINTDRILLFMHGGGYIGPLNNNYRDWGLHKGEIVNAKTVFMVNYRLAPESIYPAALEDAASAYKGLLRAGYNPNKIILMGDSAGGNLALSLAVYLRDNNLPQPKAIVLLSPWTHIGTELPARINNYEKDKMLGITNKVMSSEVAMPSYAKGADIKDPYLSPAYADLTGISSMLIIAGGDELLLDDTALVSAHAKASGVNVTEKIYRGMSHDWDIALPELPESKMMNEAIAQFVDENVK